MDSSENKVWDFISQAILWELENNGEYSREDVILRKLSDGFSVYQESVGTIFIKDYNKAFNLFKKLVVAGRV